MCGTGGRLEQFFREYQPTVVFHAAAHKHVPLMESVPDEAVKNNVFGTRNVAELSDKYGVKRFVMILHRQSGQPHQCHGGNQAGGGDAHSTVGAAE